MNKTLTLGIFGFGCVGQGLWHVLHETRGMHATIKTICVKDPQKKRSLPGQFFTYNPNDIFSDPEIDVVVELIDDADAAFTIVRTALQCGKAVVTANKKMLAEHLEEIYNLQRQYGRPVLYEGATCASIPIIRNLEEYYDNDLINSIEGIFNGSTNYILTKIFDEQLDFAQALKQAQQLGFAETDPSLDVNGYDPKFKLAILITHAFGLFVKPEEIINLGITRISEADIAYARANDLRIKLIARAFKMGEKVCGFVAPQYVTLADALAPVKNEYNAVKVIGAFAEMQVFIGKGAGSYPTGSAVLSDISALTYGYAYEYKKLQQRHDGSLSFSNDILVDVLVSTADRSAIQPEVFGTRYTATDGADQNAYLHYTQTHDVPKSDHYLGNRITYKGMVPLTTLTQWAKNEALSVILPVNAKVIVPDSSLIPDA